MTESEQSPLAGEKGGRADTIPGGAVERLDTENSSDELQVVLHEQRYEFALARISAEDSVLEVGTGMGCFSQKVVGRCKAYSGLEYDADACEITRRRLRGQGTLLQGDAQSLPFPSHSSSVIVCLEVLEHLENYRKAVAEMYRCMKPDGRAVISVPYRRRGGKNPENRFHLYEPGEAELVGVFRRYFARVEVFYQYFEETRLMTWARVLHLRSVLGLAQIYADLAQGKQWAMTKLRIANKSGGLNSNLVLVASQPRLEPLA